MADVDYSSLIRLDGRVYAVFGTGAGIGGETVRALTALGATVACLDLDGDAAAAAAGGAGLALQVDVSESGAIDHALDQVVDRFGRLDGAIDIIGAALFKPFTETTDDEWDRQVGLVVRHAFRILRAAAPLIERSGGGSLGFVSSIAGLNAAPSNGTYGMFKAAMMSMVRSAAVELGPAGIRVNCVAPGATNTPRMLATQTAEMQAIALRSTPLRKAAEPFDIAAALAFLASPMAGHITGQTLTIDGGVSLMNWRELTAVGIPEGVAP
ncbi:SDR family NAD(P)-dependent oxidoreductase [Salinibacterium sp. ZJ450]|uniref:SDR family NAD(P)-dependent oxidoreductase n=1 Tax=Salinibacterium sp. ZJ450 TaxID=2708338 RepID=UPI00141DA79C|nr:SDR family oxidoreductase [Salinibacterium sp. ZJ450]